MTYSVKKKATQVLAYRLVLHSFENITSDFPPHSLGITKNSHLDLFLLPASSDTLYTYEIDLRFHNFYEKNNTLNAPHLYGIIPSSILSNSQNNPSEPYKLWPALRKKNHRLLYWHYSGPISKGRGSVYELGKGKFFYENIDFFSYLNFFLLCKQVP